MNEIKPVYQRRIQDDDWQEIEHSEYVEFSERGKFQTHILYPAAALEALQSENFDLKLKVEVYEAGIKLLEKVRQENAAQAKRIADLDVENTKLKWERDTTKSFAEKSAQHATSAVANLNKKNEEQANEIEALRKQVETYKSEREPMRKAFAEFKHYAERNRIWTGQGWSYHGYRLEDTYNSAVEMLKKLVNNDLNLSAQKGTE